MTNSSLEKPGHRADKKWSIRRDNQVHHPSKVFLSFLVIFLISSQCKDNHEKCYCICNIRDRLRRVMDLLGPKILWIWWLILLLRFTQVLELQEGKQSFFSSRLRFTPTGLGLPLSWAAQVSCCTPQYLYCHNTPGLLYLLWVVETENVWFSDLKEFSSHLLLILIITGHSGEGKKKKRKGWKHLH